MRTRSSYKGKSDYQNIDPAHRNDGKMKSSQRYARMSTRTKIPQEENKISLATDEVRTQMKEASR
jgi:hypothetical protein